MTGPLTYTGRSLVRSCVAAAMIGLCLMLGALLPSHANAAGSYWPEPLQYQSCHGGSGSWQGAVYTQFDARFGRGSSHNAWCRFENRLGQGEAFGWGTRANVYEAHTFRSRWDQDAGQGYHYDFSGSYALNYVLGNWGDTQSVDFSNDSTAAVLGGGPFSGAGSQHYQCWGEGCYNSFAGVNITNPTFFFHQRGFNPRTYDRYLRNANHRVWMHDFQGPTIGIRGGDVGAFQCLDGVWGHNGSAWWCSGRPRFLWASHDNGEHTGIGRGNMGLYLDGNHLAATWGNLPNGDHWWDSGMGYPGTGSHAYQAYRTDAGHHSWHHGQAHPTAWTGNQWVNIDQTPPNPPAAMIATYTANVWHAAPSITVTPIGGGDQGSGVNANNFRIVNNQEGRTVNGANMVVTQEGWHGIWATARDYVGREGGGGPGINIYIDRTAPGKPGVPNVSHTTWTNGPRVDVSTATAPNPLPAGVNANAPIAYQHQYRLCGFNGVCGPWSGWSAGSAGYTTAEGRFQYMTRAYDHASNVGPQSDVRNALIDRTGPTAPAGAETVHPYTTGARTITAGAAHDNVGGGDQSGIGHYQYQTRHAIDPSGSGAQGWSAWSGWTNGPSVNVNTEGHTQVRFRAVDNAGNAGAVGNAQTVRIDRTGPTLTEGATGNPAVEWDKGDPATVTSGDAVDNPGGSGVANYQYQFVGSGDFTNPELTIHNGQQAQLLPGRWFIRFRAIDAVGNVGLWGPITIFSWIEGPIPPSPPGGGTLPGGAEDDEDGVPGAPSALRRSWGADIAEALCHLPSAETQGGINCAGGGTSWYKGRDDR